MVDFQHVPCQVNVIFSYFQIELIQVHPTQTAKLNIEGNLILQKQISEHTFRW